MFWWWYSFCGGTPCRPGPSQATASFFTLITLSSLSAFQLESNPFFSSTRQFSTFSFCFLNKIFTGWFMMMMTNFVRKKSGPLPENPAKNQVKSNQHHSDQSNFFSFIFLPFSFISHCSVVTARICLAALLFFFLVCFVCVDVEELCSEESWVCHGGGGGGCCYTWVTIERRE